MPFNIGFYEKKYAEEKASCICKAKSLINDYDENCDDNCHDAMTISYTMPLCNRVVLDRYNDITCSIVYSSGYWCTVNVRKKGKNHYRVSFSMTRMTAEERGRAHIVPDEDDEEEVKAPHVDDDEKVDEVRERS